MKNPRRGTRRLPLFLTLASFLLAGLIVLALFSAPYFHSWVNMLTLKSRRILGFQPREVFPEEKRIREEVILKKMEEGSHGIDWRALTPEYPRRRSLENVPEKEKIKVLRETPEFKEMDQEVKGYAKRKEDLLKVEPPVPSAKESTDFTSLRDKGTARAVERLLGPREKALQEKPLEENVRLGIRGPAAARKILERPSPPQIKVTVESEIELSFWILPDGTVGRVIPSVKGDAELERMVIAYLKQWRFSPLPKDQPQIEQWGAIPIKAKLR